MGLHHKITHIGGSGVQERDDSTASHRSCEADPSGSDRQPNCIEC